MKIDFSRINNLDELKSLIRQLFERFNFNYGNLINMDKVDRALNSLVPVEMDENTRNIVPVDKSQSISKGAAHEISHGAKGLFERDDNNPFNNKIYIMKNVSIDVLFHEILHFITSNHRGLREPLDQIYDDDIEKRIISDKNLMLYVRQILQLDESMTRFITELAIPEAKIKDSYQYGAGIIKAYYDCVKNRGINTDFIFNMYLDGNAESMERFKQSFGDKFYDVLSSIEQVNNMRVYLTKGINPMSNENMAAAIRNAAYNVRTKRR